MKSFVVRHVLSQALYELFKKEESKIIFQVPFVDKEGIPLPDEDGEYVTVVQMTKELLESGASPLYYVTDVESFLLPTLLNKLEYSYQFEGVKEEVIKLLMDNISEKELTGLFPEHSNRLLKEMIFYPEQLNKLINKGLQFKQDIDNRYGQDSIEIEAIHKGNYEFFMKIAQNSVNLDFDLVYQKDHYKETTLRKEVENLKEKITQYVKTNNHSDYNQEKYDSRKKTLELLEKWMLKNKIEQDSNMNINNSDPIKNSKFKI